MKIDKGQMQKLIKVLLESRKCIDAIVESNAMVEKSFIASMKLPQAMLDKRKAEEEKMEDILNQIDDFLKYVEESGKESEEKA